MFLPLRKEDRTQEQMKIKAGFLPLQDEGKIECPTRC